MIRILYDIGVVGVVLFTPWYVSLICILVGIYCFHQWYEGLLFSICADVLVFGTGIGMHTLYVICAFCGVYYVSIQLKELLRA